MVKPLKQLAILFAIIILISQTVLAFENLFSIEKEPLPKAKGFYSIGLGNLPSLQKGHTKSSIKSINYFVAAQVTDDFGNITLYKDIDSLEVCNMKSILLEVIDNDNKINSVEWYDEESNLVSSDFKLNLLECKSTIYKLVVNGSGFTNSKSINVICNDIQIEVQELVYPGTGSGIIDVNGDGTLDFCMDSMTSLTINNLDPNQILDYKWLGESGFIFSGDNTPNPNIFGLASANYSIMLQTRNQYGCSKRDQFNFSVHGITNLEIQASVFDEDGNLVESEIADSIYINCVPSGRLILSHNGVSTNGNINVQWYDENKKLIGTQTSIEIFPYGDYSYSVLISDEFGCSDYKEIAIIGNPVNSHIIENVNGTILEDVDGDGDLDLCLDFSSPLVAINNIFTDTLSYEWTGAIISGDANTNSPILSPPFAGNYLIKLQTTNQFGCTQDHFIDLEFYDFNASNEILYNQSCSSGKVDFEFDSNNFEFYSWLFTDENGEETKLYQNPATFNYITPGTYFVQLIPDNNLLCDLDTIIQEVEIVNPFASLDIGVKYLDCTDDQLTVQFYHILDPAYGAITDQGWVFNDTTTTTFTLSPIVVITDAGPFKVESRVKAEHGCGLSTTKVFDFEILETDFIQDTINACFNALDINLNPIADPNINYRWEPNPYFTQLDLINPSIDVDMDYTFELFIHDDFGTHQCKNQKFIHLQVVDELISKVKVDSPDSVVVEYSNQSATIYQCDPFVDFVLRGNSIEEANYLWADDHSFSSTSILGAGLNYEVSSPLLDGEKIYRRSEKNGCLSDVFEIEFKLLLDPKAIISFDYTPNAECEPSVLTLLADTTNTPSEVSEYNWSGPNGFFSNEKSPQISTTGNENGTYKLTIENKAGCNTTYTMDVSGIITPTLPDPIISSTGLSCEGEKVVLSVPPVSGTNVEYVWTFPSSIDINGQGTNELNISLLDDALHLGDYTIQIFKEDCVSGIDSFTLRSIIEVEVTNEPICQGRNLVLEVDAPLGVTFVWQGPEGFYSEGKSPFLQDVNESNNGLYSVLVENSNGCIVKKEFSVSNIFAALPQPDLNINGPVCKGDDLLLSTTAIADLYDWIGPLSFRPDVPNLQTSSSVTAIDQNSPAYLSGDWKVMVTDEQGCTAISNPVSVGINEVPTATIIGDNTVCEGGTLKIFAATVENGIYEWFDDDPNSNSSPISNNQSIEITNIAAGFYTYYLRVSKDGCPSELSKKNYLIKDKPVSIPSYEFITGSDCKGFNLTLSADVSGEGPFEYAWTGPNNFSSSEPTPLIDDFTSEHLGDYLLEITDSNDCKNYSDKLEVLTILNLPVSPLIEVEGNSCADEIFKLKLSNYDASINNVVWSYPSSESIGFSSNKDELFINALAAVHEGNYTVSIELPDCSITSDVFLLNLNEQPTIALQSTSSALCNGSDLKIESTVTNGSTYQWEGPNGFTSSNKDVLIEDVSEFNNGVYSLTVTSSQGCIATEGIQISSIAIYTSPTLFAEDICPGENIILKTNLSGSSFEWISPLGATGDLTTSENEILIHADDIHYLAGNWSVIVTDANGCTSTSSPTALSFYNTITPDLNSPNELCQGETILLSTNNVSDIYEWKFTPQDANESTIELLTNEGNLEIGDQDATYKDGTWTVTINSLNGCSFSSTEATIQIRDLPEAIAENSGPYCKEANEFSLSTNAIAGANYFWYKGDASDPSNLISNEQNPSIAVTDLDPELIYFLVVEQDGCRSIPSKTEIELYDGPTLMPFVSYSFQNDCSVDGVSLNSNVNGSGPFSYKWIGPNNFTSIEEKPTLLIGLGSALNGLYTLNITDSRWCTNLSQVEVSVGQGITTPEIIVSDIEFCEGSTITLSAPMYTGQDITYQWDTPLAPNTPASISSSNMYTIQNAVEENEGSYTVSVLVDGCQSEISLPVHLLINEAPNVTTTDLIEVCGSISNSLTLSSELSDGTASFNFEWTGPNNYFSNEENPVLTNLTSINTGSYQIQVTDTNNCVSNIATTTVDLFQPPVAPIIGTMNSDLCPNEPLIIEVENYSEEINYIWVLADGSEVTTTEPKLEISNVQTGIHTGVLYVYVEENNCTSNFSNEVVINLLAEPDLSSVSNSSISAEPCSVESIVLQAPILDDAQYEWTGPNNFYSTDPNPVLTSLNSVDLNGTYILSVTNENACISYTSTEVSIVDQIITPELVAENSVVCEGESIIISAPIYQGENVIYEWILPSGEILVENDPTSNVLTISDATASYNGGYSVQVFVDDCTSSVALPINIDVVAPPILAPMDDFTICDGETSEIELISIVSGGIPPLTYNWTGPNNFISFDVNPTIQNLEFDSGGVYELSVKDALGCQSNYSSVEIEVVSTPTTPIISSNTTVLCQDESLEITISNHFDESDYLWLLSDNSIIQTTLPQLIIDSPGPEISEGPISVSISNGFCLSERSNELEISFSDPIDLQDVLIEGKKCIAEEVQLDAPILQGAIYSWTGPNNFYSTLRDPQITINENVEVNGDYELTISDSAGCEIQSTTTVNLLPGIEAPILEINSNEFCFGEEIIISTSSYEGDEISYKWIFPDQNSIQNAVTQTNTLIIEEAEYDNEGLYTVAVYVDGCLSYSSNEIFVEINETPVVLLQEEYKSCVDDDIVLTTDAITGLAPYTYLWSGPDGFTSTDSNPTLSNLSADMTGNYSLLVTDANNCSSDLTSTRVEIIELPPTPIVDANEIQVCEGQSLELYIQNYSESLSYQWTLGDGSQINTSDPILIIDEANIQMHDGFFTVKVEDDECDSAPSDNLYISIVPQPETLEITNTSAQLPACEGEEVQLIAPYFKGAVYTWLGSNDFISNEQSPILNEASITDAGVYTMFIDLNNCASEIVETIVQIEPNPATPIIEDIDVVCENAQALLSVQNPDPEILYHWYKSSSNLNVGTGITLNIPNANQTDSGPYFVIGKSAYCDSAVSDEKSLSVESQAESAAFAGEDAEVCEPDYQLGLDPLNDKEGYWKNLDFNSNAEIIDINLYQTIVTDLEVGENLFSWQVSNAVCFDQLIDTISIIYTPYPDAADDYYTTEMNSSFVDNVIQNDILNTIDYTVSLATQPLHGILFLNEDGTFEYNPNENYIGKDNYEYLLCNNSCLDDCVVASVFISVGEESECFVPSVFTPNKDGTNDNFMIPFITQFSNNKLTIYNRWGTEVFHSDDYKNDWDGTYKDNTLPSGTYYYILNINDEKQMVKYGYVFIQR